jgi:hypothetical protein
MLWPGSEGGEADDVQQRESNSRKQKSSSAATSEGRMGKGFSLNADRS